jgi:tripartite-type tricarboxylate transporter receptor subunit TctC
MRKALVVLIAVLFGATAQAETYPSRPITLMVPAAAGGGNDTVARTVAEKMSRILGQQIVIEIAPARAAASRRGKSHAASLTATPSASAIRRRSRSRLRCCRMSATIR